VLWLRLTSGFTVHIKQIMSSTAWLGTVVTTKVDHHGFLHTRSELCLFNQYQTEPKIFIRNNKILIPIILHYIYIVDIEHMHTDCLFNGTSALYTISAKNSLQITVISILYQTMTMSVVT